MTMFELYQKMLTRFLALPGAGSLLSEPVRITPDPEPEVLLLPEGSTSSFISRPEYRVTAVMKGVCGEAYTECPKGFEGTLKEVLDLPVSEEGIPAQTLAAINAAMSLLGLCPGSFADDPAVHAAYADNLCRFVTEQYGSSNLVLIGYDGYIVKRFSEEGLDFWTLDRNPSNITQDCFNHVIVNSGKYNREACFAWGKVLLITGSTFCNGTVLHFLNRNVPVLFYGITCAGISKLLDLPWFPVPKN